jgi:hypothetical protein
MDTEGTLQPEVARVEMSAQIDKIAEALAAAQGAMENPVMNQTATLKFKNEDTGNWISHEYSYADLDACLKCVKKPFAENGLSLVQLPRNEFYYPKGSNYLSAYVAVDTVLLHKSGQWIRNSVVMTSAKISSHAIGSAITYGRRYGLCALVGIAAERDDDAAGAVDGADKKADAPAPAKPAQTAQKPAQAQTAQTPPKAPAQAPAPASSQKKGQPAKNGKTAYVVNEKEQKDRGCINSTLVAELRQAVLTASKDFKLDPTSEFMPWLDQYLDMLCSTPGMEAYKREHKGTAQLLLDIPSTAYAEILERVQKDPTSCKPAVEASEEQAQDDSGVA